MINPIYFTIITDAVNREAKKRGKPLSWLKYATKMRGKGYQFLPDKEAQWKILERLSLDLKGRLHDVTVGRIIDMIGDYVNAV